MSQDDERGRSIREKIARLRTRLHKLPASASQDETIIRAVLLGLLDLLGDEL